MAIKFVEFTGQPKQAQVVPRGGWICRAGRFCCPAPGAGHEVRLAAAVFD